MSDLPDMNALVAIAREIVAAQAPEARVRLGKIPEHPSARIEWDTDSAISTFLFWAAGNSYSEVMDVEDDPTALRKVHESFADAAEFRARVGGHLAFVAAA